MEKVWHIEDPDEKPRSRRSSREKGLPEDRKDPAAAYSLSILFWGSGQYYADHIVKGLAFIFQMLFIVAGVILAFRKRQALLDLLRSRGIARSDAFLWAEILLIVVLLFWAYNAADAYHAAVRQRRRPFTGVKSRVFPGLCSLLVPGWGQYLNGQPVKGSLFASLAVIGYFALVSAPLTLLAWPRLEPADSRDIIEGILAADLFVVLFVPALWIFSCYDALKVSRDDYLKEPFLERLKALNNRRRTQGWVRGVVPRIGNIFILIVVFALIVAVAHWAFPEGYYVSLLDSAARYLTRQGMTIVPEMLRTVLTYLPHS